MTRGLVLVADGVDDVQFGYAFHRLREDAVLVDVAAPDGGPVTTGAGAALDATGVADLPSNRRYDLAVVPGGDGSAELAADDVIRRLVSAHVDAGGVVGALAEGVGVLLAFGVLDGRLVAAPADLDDALAAGGARPSGEAVTVDGPFVTARDADGLPYAIAATLSSVSIPQDAAAEARERAFWQS